MEGQKRSQAQPTTKFDGFYTCDSDLPAWPPLWPEIQASIERAMRQGWWGQYRSPQADELANRLGTLAGTDPATCVDSNSPAGSVPVDAGSVPVDAGS
ncbi:hypothetical protein CGZ80_13710, partial [Rhodopirellula sp. MGV]